MCNTHTVVFLPHKAVLHALCPQKYINNFSIVPVSFILVLALGRKEKRCCFFIKSKLYFWWTQEIWTTQPIAAILMFGFPLLVFSFLIYMLCIADPGPEEEDLEELQDEGTEYLYDEDGERELKATEEEVDANPKPKTEWSILFGNISIVSSFQLRQLLPCQNRIDSKYSTRDVQVFLKNKWDWFSLTCIGSGIFSDWW